jgi:cytochrome c peroxidase
MGSSSVGRRWPSRLAFLASASCLVLVGCGGDSNDENGPDPILPAQMYDYVSLSLRPPFSEFRDRTPSSNPVTNAGATLGRVLFYDKHISRNNTKACGSCHHQDRAFTDGLDKAIGFDGQHTARNAMTLSNLRFQRSKSDPARDRDDDDFFGGQSEEDFLLEAYGLFRVDGFFSDLRAPTLEELALMPIQDRIELGMNLSELPGKLDELSYYPELFRAAFGDSTITTDRIAKALAQFIRSMVSSRSKFDDGLAATGGSPYEEFSNFTAQENQGKRIFLFTGRCGVCHNAAGAVAAFASNNGLDETSTDLGIGAMRQVVDPATGRNRLDGFFKATTLRNVEVTGPYMHDGRFATLEQVVDHYDTQVKSNPTLSPLLRGEFSNSGSPRQLHLTAENKAALIAFLKTMTDHELMADPKLSDPFPR